MSSSEATPTILCSIKSCLNPGVKQCTKCKCSKYCCQECQLADWKHHKRLCNVKRCPQKMLLLAERYSKDGDHMYERALYDGTLVEYRKAASIFQELLGDYHEFTMECHRSIGPALSGTSQYEEALVELHKALAICREVLGEDHQETAECYEVIGSVFFQRGEPDDALIGYGEALAIRLQLFGNNHIMIAYSYHNVAAVLMKKRQCNDALLSLRKVHGIYLREYGEHHHPTTLTSEC